MSRAPILVKSIPHWFQREYPHFPWECVVLCEMRVNWTALNPYKARVAVIYSRPDDFYYRVYGLIHYGEEDLRWDPPLFPPPAAAGKGAGGGEDQTMDGGFRVIEQVWTGRYRSTSPMWIALLWEACRLEGMWVEKFRVKLLAAIREDPRRWVPRDAQRLESPSVTDLQWHYRTYPGLFAPPDEWFEVPITLVTPEMAKSMPMWGLFFHVTRRQLETDCAWRNFQQKEWERGIGAPPSLLAGSAGEERRGSSHPPQMELLFSYITSLVGVRKRRQHVELDSEAVTARMPPCMRRMVDSGEYPKDFARQRFVRTLRRAGIELDIVESYFIRWAKGSLRDARNRWRYDLHYEMDYAPPSCEEMCKGDLCPFPAETVDWKKAACHREFREKFPDRADGAKPRTFNGPIKWFEW